MTDQFLGEIRIFPFNFAPVGWASCDGQILSIAQNTAVFALLGTFYGGNGTSNFALPNLQGNVAVGMGQGPGLSDYFIGQSGGSAAVALLSSEMPQHNHGLFALAASGTTNQPAGNFPAMGHGGGGRGTFLVNDYAPLPLNGGGTTLAPTQLNTFGGSQPHNNLQPYLALNFCIALQGIFPARS